MAVYPFTKRVRPQRLATELRAAIPAEGGVEVISCVNASHSAPFNGKVVTSRDLTPAEVTTGTQVIQAHDATEPEGDAAVLKAARQAAQGLVGVAFADMTTGQLRTCIALLCACFGAVEIVGGVARFKMPPENPLGG